MKDTSATFYIGPAQPTAGQLRSQTFIRLAHSFGLQIQYSLDSAVQFAFAFGYEQDAGEPGHEFYGKVTKETLMKGTRDFKTLINAKRKVINVAVRSTRKDILDSLHCRIFGYSASVDPRQYRGEMVEKSIYNFKHDGEIVCGPIPARREAKIYQKLIESTDLANHQLDIRTVVCNGRPVLCALHSRPLEHRFGVNRFAIDIDVCDPKDYFTSAELSNLQEFVSALQLDFGELDILRCNRSGQIYIVDVNTTPGSGNFIFNEDCKIDLPLLCKSKLPKIHAIRSVIRRTYSISFAEMLGL